VLGGSAVFEAANALLAKIRAAAGARLGCADDPDRRRRMQQPLIVVVPQPYVPQPAASFRTALPLSA
jgi:hypothetical protein